MEKRREIISNSPSLFRISQTFFMQFQVSQRIAKQKHTFRKQTNASFAALHLSSRSACPTLLNSQRRRDCEAVQEWNLDRDGPYGSLDCERAR